LGTTTLNHQASETMDRQSEAASSSRDRELALAARVLIGERLRCLQKFIDRQIDLDDIVLRPTAPDSRRHLFEEACELYWNELNWEQLTDEEVYAEGELTEMVFPGLLTLIDALLPRADNGEPDRDREYRDVAHDFLLWVAQRLVELRTTQPEDDSDRERLRRERTITDELVDLVAYRLYCLTEQEIERLQR